MKYALPSTRGILIATLLLLTVSCGTTAQTSPPTNPASAEPAQSTPAAANAPTAAAAPTQAAPAAAASPTAVPVATPAANEFQNPVLRADFADPGVLKVGDTYYAYATNAVGKNIQVARSTDLISWTQLPDALPALPGWAKLGGSLVWAPEVAQIGEQFLMYYTARDKASNRQCIGVAVSDKPEGRFADTRDAPFICQADQGGSIDASPFYDGQTWYLYWKNDGNCCSKPTYLYVQEMAPDGLSLVGEPVQLIRNDAAWEGKLVEAPTMVQRDGSYYLFFSANDYAGHQYAVGYATCQSARGPCTDAPENPILKSRMDRKPLIVGPGHQTVIQVDDQLWIVYHAWEINSNGLRGNRRFLYLDRLNWQDGKPVVAGPTTDPQPRP